ncbi:glycosyltransferase family 8 protein [Celeribacter sp.]|uniref:glycosyltransferase family 8 protein n=1 Tax=Celeribacter sp. TaxID=1890673 RepID=UPI003A92D6E9
MSINVAFVTDMGFLTPTLTAVDSPLRHTNSHVVVHFVDHELTKEGLRDLELVIAHHSNANLCMHVLTSDLFAGMERKDPRIALVTLGRMFLPTWVEGRVLYLDGDILVEGDVAPLFDLDMQGKPIGVVRDFMVLYYLCGKNKPYEYFSGIMSPRPASDYFKAGVLLIDCNAIRADKELNFSMTDMRAAGAYDYLDQDHLNVLFKGRTLILDGCWNAAWGKVKPHHRFEN